MIRYLEGVIAHTAPLGIVLVTGGVGYHVHTLQRDSGLIGEASAYHTHLAVRETALDLYGFRSQIELEFFELLLTIPKVGPKSALQILDRADLTLIIESIKLQDPSNLSKLSGLSKKTAEKLVIALKDKIDVFAVLVDNQPQTNSTTYQDAFDTLITLGFNPINIKQVLDTLPNEDSTSTLVKTALRQLN